MPAKRYMYIVLIFLPIFAFSINYNIKGYIKNKHTKPVHKLRDVKKFGINAFNLKKDYDFFLQK